MHAMVDRLLGFDRKLGESRLQLTPVEWGDLELLDPPLRSIRSNSRPERNRDEPGPLLAGDLTIDRVGPDPFDTTGLGAIVTVRWSVRLGNVVAAVRLWIAESVVQLWLATPPSAAFELSSGSESLEPGGWPGSPGQRRGGLTSTWCARAVLWPCPKD